MLRNIEKNLFIKQNKKKILCTQKNKKAVRCLQKLKIEEIKNSNFNRSVANKCVYKGNEKQINPNIQQKG